MNIFYRHFPFLWLICAAFHLSSAVNVVHAQEEVEVAEAVEEVQEAPEEAAGEEADTAAAEQAAEADTTAEAGEESVNWVDHTRNWLYDKSHGAVIWLDTKFVDEENQNVVETPPSRFRIGLQAQAELRPEGSIEFSPVVDFDTDVDLPNLEERLKLFITTRDPVELEGATSFEEDNSLRVGASKGFLENWNASAGVKTKWLPEIFTFVQWNPRYGQLDGWTTYPNIKLFWESEDRLGASTALVFNRWRNRLLFRQTFSGKITKDDLESDDKKADDPESPQFGDDGGGVRWLASTTLGYVPHLLDERDYGRRVGGKDVARGVGIRGQIRGNAVKSLEAKVTLFHKRPIYKDFLFLVLAPEVVWDEEESWKEEYILNVGVEMLVWGDDPIIGN